MIGKNHFRGHRGLRFAGLITGLLAGVMVAAGVSAADEPKIHPASRKAEAKNMRLVGYSDLQARSAYQPLVHHQGKAAERGMRGSSALLGALDCALQAKKQDALLEVVTHKQKDHEPAEPMWFRTEQVEFQVTAFDDPDSSLVLELLEEKPTTRPELTPAERKCLEALYEAIIAHGFVASDIPWPTCTLDQWRETAAGMTITDGGPDAHRKAFKRAATKLEAKGIVAARNGRIWPVRYAENGKNEADYEN